MARPRVGVGQAGMGSGFYWYWASVAVSGTGSAVSGTVIPIIAVTTLHASADEMGVLWALGLVPSLLLQVAVGSWADAIHSRVRALVVTDLLCAGLVALVPVLWVTHTLQFRWLAVIIGLKAIVGVTRLACTSPVVTDVVTPEMLVTATGRINATNSVTDIAGNSLGGGLLSLVAAPAALFADVASFLLSALLASRIRIVDAEPPGDKTAPAADRATTRSVARSVFTDINLWCVLPIALANGVAETVLVLYCIRDLHIKPPVIGVLLAFGAAGGVVGGFLVGRLQKRSISLPLVIGIGAAAWALLPLAAVKHGLPAYLAVVNYELAGAFGGTIVIAAIFGRIQRAAQRKSVSRTMAIANNTLQVASLAGIAIGALVGSYVSARASIIAAEALVIGLGLPLLAFHLKRAH